MKTYIAAAILIVTFIALDISAMPQNSATCDEVVHHIPVGYVFLTKGDFKMDTSHPPLAKCIMALPLKLFMNLNMPDDKSIWRVENRSVFGKDFFYKYNNDPHRILFLSRLSILFLGILCAILLFAWTRFLYGSSAALLSLFLYALSPDILANATLATTDMPATFFILLSAYSFWRFLKSKSSKNMLLSGICLGLAQLSKYTAVILYPVFLMILFLDRHCEPCTRAKRVAQGEAISKFIGIVFISLLVIWAGYGFDAHPMLKDAMRVEEKIDIAHNLARKAFPSISEGHLRLLDKILLEFPMPLGAQILGIMGVVRHGQAGHATYFLGKWSGYGSPFYFLTAFLIKTPMPAIIFLLAGILTSLKNRIKSNDFFLLVIASSFLIAASLGKLQLGVRYILPAYPFLFMLAGKSAALLKKKILKWPVILLMMWSVFIAFSSWPHYLGYFNEFVGGPANGYKYLRDSNVDWGQDLPSLSKYMSGHGIGEVALLYFGEADPKTYGIKFKNLSDKEKEKPGNKVYAVSANYLEGVNWSKKYKPTAMAGYSIFIYDFRKGIPAAD